VTDSVELSIVIPCLNEAETLARCIEKARLGIQRAGVRGEIIVADNGSTDGSPSIAQKSGARVVPVKEKGYGSALRGGIQAASGKWILMGDADDSYDFSDITGFVNKFREGFELIMGCRLPVGGGTILPGAMPWKNRWLGNPVLSGLGRWLFHVPVGDFHCGMRAFRRDRVLALGLRCDGMEFATEMIVRASMAGLTFAEVPTTLRPDGRSRAPHLRTWRDGWRHLRFLLAFSPRWLVLYPALALFTVGAAGLLWLSFGPRAVGHIEFSVQSMLVCATAVIVGMQAASLAVASHGYLAHLEILPPSPRLERFIERLTLERGLLGGVLSTLLGMAAFVTALVRWSSTGFGQLDVISTIRVPIIGMVLVVGGLQLIMLSFMMSLVRVERGE